MKNEELLQNAIGMIGDDLIADADCRPRRPRIIRWSAVACACLAVIIAVGAGWLWRRDEPGVEPPDVDPPVVEPPNTDPDLSNGIIFASWEQFKILYDAALAGDDEFLEKSRRLERYDMDFYDYDSDFLISFEACPTSVKIKDVFLDMYGEIAERQILVPLDPTIIQLEDIYISSYWRGKVNYSVAYRIPYGEIKFSLLSWPAGNYADDMASQEGELLPRIKANGYFADVWSYRTPWGTQHLTAFLTLDGDDYPRFKVEMRTTYSQQKDIPQEFILLLGQFRVSTAKEMLTNAGDMDLPELPKFNVISEYQPAGQRLVNPVIVSEKEFFSLYLDESMVDGLSGMFREVDWDWIGDPEIQYRFDCAMDPDTLETDLSFVVNGVITLLRDGKVAQVLYISDKEPVINYILDCNSVVVENFFGVDVALYDLSKEGQPLYYSVFQIGKYYFTYSLREGEPYDMIKCMDILVLWSLDCLDYVPQFGIE